MIGSNKSCIFFPRCNLIATNIFKYYFLKRILFPLNSANLHSHQYSFGRILSTNSTQITWIHSSSLIYFSETTCGYIHITGSHYRSINCVRTLCTAKGDKIQRNNIRTHTRMHTKRLVQNE